MFGEEAQNPFSKPLQKLPAGGNAEVKQPAGVLPASKPTNPPDAGLRLMALAETTATFYQIVQNDSKDPQAAPYYLKVDASLPQYPQARLCRFAPKNGAQAAIVTQSGLHLVDMK